MKHSESGLKQDHANANLHANSTSRGYSGPTPPASSSASSVVIIDGNQVFMDAIAGWMDEYGFMLDATGRDAQEAITLVRAFQPNILLIPATTADTPLSFVASMVWQCSPATRIVVTTLDPASAQAHLLELDGVWGVISLTSTMSQMFQELNKIASLVKRPRVPIASRAPDRLVGRGRPTGSLSRRELEVLELLASGETNAGIATELGISAGTVKRHISNVYGKLGVGSRVDALRRGVALGLLRLGPHTRQGQPTHFGSAMQSASHRSEAIA